MRAVAQRAFAVRMAAALRTAPTERRNVATGGAQRNPWTERKIFNPAPKGRRKRADRLGWIPGEENMAAHERRFGGKLLVITFVGSLIGVSVAIYLIARFVLLAKA